MATPREELEELRAMAAQQQQVSPRQELEQLRAMAASPLEQIPTGIAGITPQKFSTAQPLPEPTLGEKALGGMEAALATLTGLVGGAPGYLYGAAKGIGEELLTGRFGEGIAEREAAKAAQALTFAPRTPTGQEYTREIGELAQQIPPVVPPLAEAAMVSGGVRPAVTQAVTGARDIAEGIFKYQTPTKQRIGQMLAERVPDIETARFQLKQQPTDIPQTKIQQFFNTGGPKITKDKIAIETIRQGFDEGVVAVVKGATPENKKLMRQMVDIMEKGKKNTLFAMTNRPTDVAGDSLMARFKIVNNVNKQAGKQLDKVAANLKGKKVAYDTTINSFVDDLSDMGIQVDDNLNLIFRGSDIEGLDVPINTINNVWNRMRNTTVTDAYDLHRMKRFIDEQVTFGKNSEGLAGRAEIILKGLRRNINNDLGNASSAYRNINTRYSETIQALDNFQDIAGKRMDLTGPNAEKAVGTLTRRLMGNVQSRVNLLDSIDELNNLAVKHGGKFNDDLMSLVLFADELDSVFSPVARTSFQGQIGQAVERAARTTMEPKGEAIRIVGKAAEKIRGINQENAFKSIKGLLGRNATQ